MCQIQEVQSIALLQWKGRWTTERSVQHYLQVGLAASAMATLPQHTKARIQSLAHLAPVILHPTCNGLRPPNAAYEASSRRKGWECSRAQYIASRVGHASTTSPDIATAVAKVAMAQ
eukprot:5176224-Amphidinium_carterae.1